jgi:hypothetical protein
VQLEFGTDVDHDLLETLFGRLRGYTFRATLPPAQPADYRLNDIAQEGRWSLMLEPLNGEGQPTGPPLEASLEEVMELTIY